MKMSIDLSKLPKPYYQDEWATIYCGDCREILPGLADKSIDLVLSDPPYGVGMCYDVYDDTEENWFELMSWAIPQMRRVGKMVIIPSCQIKRLDWFYANHKPDWLICWYKGSVGCAAFTGFNDWEPLVVYGKNNTTMHDYFHASPEPQTNGHPCQKPQLWSKWLIARATNNNGDIVLDPFMGSGTTIITARQLNRKCIGIELSEKYCEIAAKRCSQSVMKLEV